MSKERKYALRERMAAVRDAIPPDERAARSSAIAERVNGAWEQGRFGHGAVRQLACYVPFRSEADVMPVMRRCWARGTPVAVPRVDRRMREMTLHYVAGEQELQPGAYGIREPVPHAPQAALAPGTLVLVPGLAF